MPKRPVRLLGPGLLGVLLVSAVAGCGSKAGGGGGRLEIDPSTVDVLAGGSVRFTGRVAGVAVTGVSWTASAGSITGDGIYTAPPRTGAYRISAAYEGRTAVATARVAAPGTPAALRAAASSTCANMPLRSTGTIHYFCDCQTGAQAGCVQGDDTANDGLSPATPKRTWIAAVETFNSMNAGDTIALCKGGLWDVPAGGAFPGGLCGYAPAAPSFENPRCAPGEDLADPANPSTCDLRDYSSPLFTGTARPVLFAHQSGDTHIINRNGGSTDGVRVLNLELRGGNAGPRGGVYSNHMGIAFDLCNPGTESEWFVCNNTFANLRVGMIWGALSTPRAEVIWGNMFDRNDLDGILGSPGDVGRIDANLFDNNGGFGHPITGNQAHSLYLAPSGVEQLDVQVVNNEFRRSAAASTPGPCASSILMGHDVYTRLNVENNLIDAGLGAAGSCWAMDLRAAGSPATHYRSTTIRRNWIDASGAGIVLGQAPDSIIENNVVVLSGDGDWKQGIMSPQDEARPGMDDVQHRTVIRNNTIYITGGSPNHNGILVGTEGTGHVIANNAVHSEGGTCIRTPLPVGAYAFVGNNACTGGAVWGTTLDATGLIAPDPMFTSAPTDLTPAAGSPLVGAAAAAHAPALDHALKPRLGPPSIGAFEP